MFAHQDKLKKADLLASAKNLVKDQDKFNNCLSSRKYNAQIKRDIEDGKKLGIKSTPTFFINGKMVNGAQPLHVFSELVDQELARKNFRK